MSRDTAKHISEVLAFIIYIGLLMMLFIPPTVSILLMSNSIAGSVITDRNKTFVPLTPKIQENRISLAWGFRKMWRNNLWWMH